MAFIDVFIQEHKQRRIYGVARSTDALKIMCIVFLLSRVKATLTYHILLGLFDKYNKGERDYTYLGPAPSGTAPDAPDPESLDTELIWDENIGAPEWVFTSYASGDNTIVVNTADPQNGTNNIEVTGIAGFDSLRFVRSAFTTLKTKQVSFWLKLKTTYDNTALVGVYLKRAEHVTVSMLHFKSGEYGFDGDSLVYQLITLPIEAFTNSTVLYDRIWVQFTDRDCTGYFFDNMNVKFIE